MKTVLRAILLLTFAALLSCKNNDEGKQGVMGVGGENYHIEGAVLNIPRNATLDLMLFSVDAHNKPERLLVARQYKGDGNTISFQLPFELKSRDSFKNLELRGRVIEKGKSIEFLTPWRKITQKNLKKVILELNTQHFDE